MGNCEGEMLGNAEGIWVIFSLVPIPPCHISMN